MQEQYSQPSDHAVGVLPFITLVLWVGCSIIGWLGTIDLVPVRLLPAASAPAPLVQTIVVDVQLAQTLPEQQTPAQNEEQLSRNDPSQLTPLPAPTMAPAAAVAAPSPMIAFAQPIEGPVRIVSADQAAPTRPLQQNVLPTNTIVAAPPVVRFSKGERTGSQPEPDYPLEARMAHQHGTVVIRLNVDESGNVTSARILQPSPFPLLNEAALQTVREVWRFPTGPPRCYDAPFDFNLKQQH